MLPRATDNGERLAAILPSGIAAVKNEDIRSFVMIVVDGLGYAALRARRRIAPVLSGLQTKRIETVTPSTTGAALTTLTTGVLPGEHGLIGYRIRHPRLGLVTTLRDWEGIHDRREWQRAEPLFRRATEVGARAVAIGRPAHAAGGLTEAILSGAEFHAGKTIADRFALAGRLLRGGAPMVMYLYVDELDRSAHKHGWQSEEWGRWLERLDRSLDDLLRTIPGNVGVVVTADHGMVDVLPHQQILLDTRPDLLTGVAEVGGEPRFRSLYVREGVDPAPIAAAWGEAEGARAWVSTREDAIASGVFGEVAPEVAPRLGDVLIAARKQVAYYSSADRPQSRAMVGQHGSLSEDERGVPLVLAGALAGSDFVTAVAKAAAAEKP